MTSASEQTRSWSADPLDGKRFYPEAPDLHVRALIVASRFIEMFYSEEEVCLALRRISIEEALNIFEGTLDGPIGGYRQGKL